MMKKTKGQIRLAEYIDDKIVASAMLTISEKTGLSLTELQKLSPRQVKAISALIRGR